MKALIAEEDKENEAEEAAAQIPAHGLGPGELSPAL